MENQLSAFEGKPIRSLEHEGEIWFAIVDIIEVLTESKQPSVYWANIKRREPQILSSRKQLKMKAADGKSYKTDCANTEGVFRIIMSVPSPNALAVKVWLSETGREKLGSQTVADFVIEMSNKNVKTIKNYTKTYLMHDYFRNVYKIGKSYNPTIREKTLQSELPTIQMIHVIDDDVEKLLHEKFKSKRTRGEWFNLSENDIKYIKSWKAA